MKNMGSLIFSAKIFLEFFLEKGYGIRKGVGLIFFAKFFYKIHASNCAPYF